MGHAGAIISGNSGKAQQKVAGLAAAGVTIAQSPTEVGITTKKVLQERN
jgi:succinyl-CoA synthetase alpha subunit